MTSNSVLVPAEALCIETSHIHTSGGPQKVDGALRAEHRALELEEVDEMLRGDGHQGALRVRGGARVAAVLEHT